MSTHCPQAAFDVSATDALSGACVLTMPAVTSSCAMQRSGQWVVQEVEVGEGPAQVGGMGQGEEGVQGAQGKPLLEGEKVLLEGEVCTVRK